VDSKERVRKALAFEEPDRVPAGEFAVDFDTARRILGHETFLRAKAASQIAFWEGRRDEVVQSWKEDSVELYRKLDVYDIVNVNATAFGQAPPADYEPDPPRKIAEDTWEDREGRVFRLSQATMDISLIHDPRSWEREYKVEDYDEHAEVKPPDPSVFEVVDHVIAELGNERYILWAAGDEAELPTLSAAESPLSERTLCEYALNPELMDAVSRAQFARAEARDAYCLRPGQDGVLWGQDFAYRNGPLISPDMFRRHVTRYAARRVEKLRALGIPVFKHACGNNRELMDQFLEIGYACYQSIQQSAGMDLGETKAAWGRRICLWGGVPVELLVDGGPDEVRAAVRKALGAGIPGGGYIFGSSHSIAVGTKYDNFMAMLDEFEKLRYYPRQ
jgi:hypothetical protein